MNPFIVNLDNGLRRLVKMKTRLLYPTSTH